MAKTKKPKKEVNLKPEYVLDPKAQEKQKKRKKNAPDRPQPEWMFPPAEENPVLNPKAKPRERQDKEKKDHDHAIKFLKYKSVNTPLKPPPPALLLTLVGSFLTAYGFNSTSRLYTTELASRKKLDEWEVLLDEALPKGFPDLVKLFKVGQKTYDEQKHTEETSGSDKDDGDERKGSKKSRKQEKAVQTVAAKIEETSSSGSDDSSEDDDSDKEMADAPPVIESVAILSGGPEHNSSSSSISSSDSDADDESEAAGANLSAAKPSQISDGTAMVSTKRKALKKDMSASVKVRGRGGTRAVNLSSAEESSSENSQSGENVAAAVVAVVGSKQIDPSAAAMSNSDSDSTSSTSESESEPEPKSSSAAMPDTTTAMSLQAVLHRQPRTGSSSSETLQGATDHKTTTAETSLSSSLSDSDSDSNTSDPAHKEAPTANLDVTHHESSTAKKRKFEDAETTPGSQKQQKKTNTPFERVPKDTPVDERFTNKYKSYDYADRAYQDLSITKGKGFTKEKNKKKRGSYRGGAIDVGGGKGIKFED